MSNVENKDINDFSYSGETIVLDKARTLRLGIKGLKLLSKKFGSIDKAFEKLDKKKMDEEYFDNLVVFVHACLVHEDDKLSIKKVEDSINFHQMTEIFEKVTSVIEGSMPGKKDESKEVEKIDEGKSQ